MKRLIKVTIVDDKPIFARTMQMAVKSYSSLFDEVEYGVTSIAGPDAYNLAKERIEKKPGEIDVLMVDYNIGAGIKGTELFRSIETDKYAIYRILYSVTDKSINEAQEQLRVSYDVFCDSKSIEEVHTRLRKYEEEILSIKLKGIAEFGPDGTNYAGEAEKFGDITFEQIIYAHTDGKSEDTIIAFYRDQVTGEIRKVARTTRSVRYFLESGFCFKRVNQSLFINMQWVAKVDLIKNRIRFIGLNNEIPELDYTPTKTFEKEILPLLPQLEKAIPPFFKR